MFTEAMIWNDKGATMSDKSAREEFGLSQEEIIDAMRTGKLQYRESSMYGNSWYRLLRHEVEALVLFRGGPDYLRTKKLEKELADLEKEKRKLNNRLKAIDRKKAELIRKLESGV